MPGPQSNPVEGKTRLDRQTGKWERHLKNRHADPIRENGGKQFKKSKEGS